MKIAIAGYGIEGEANYRYYAASGEHDITIVDEKPAPSKLLPEGVKTLLGEDVFSKLDGYDLVIRTAGLNPRRITTDGKIWSSTNEFFATCPAPIIGVTGTKGKGTTASLIASILRAAGRKVFLVGNIGLPALSALPEITAEDIVVFELSSFQLWDLEKSPHVAVVLMIEPDHLDVHDGFTDYLEAKANICKHQTPEDICIYHPINEFSAEVARTSGATRVGRFGISDDGMAYVDYDQFVINNEQVCSTRSLQLIGTYNLDNACAALSAIWPYTEDHDAIDRGIRDFHGLPHRLRLVRRVNEVEYYDNSIGTTPGSAIVTIRSFDKPKIIILGGSSKGVSYEEVIRECKETRTRVIAIGDTGEEIVALCRAQGVPCTRVIGLMDVVVRTAHSMAEPGSVVLLSPASASFDQYASYTDRGEKFIQAVERI